METFRTLFKGSALPDSWAQISAWKQKADACVFRPPLGSLRWLGRLHRTWPCSVSSVGAC